MYRFAINKKKSPLNVEGTEKVFLTNKAIKRAGKLRFSARFIVSYSGFRKAF